MLLPRVWSYKILRSYRILHHLSGAEREREREGSLLSVLFLYSFCLFVHMSYCDNSLLIFCGLSGECIYQYVNAGLHLAEFIGNGMLLCISLSPSILYASMRCLCRSAGFICCFADCTVYVLMISHICAQLLACELDYIWIWVLLILLFLKRAVCILCMTCIFSKMHVTIP